MSADRHRTVRAVEISGIISVGLELSKIRETIDVGPTFIAPRSPGVEIFGSAADECLAVDRTRTPHGLASRDWHQFRLLRRSLAAVRPVERAAGLTSLQIEHPPTVFQRVRQLFKIRVFGPCFQQQNRSFRVLR